MVGVPQIIVLLVAVQRAAEMILARHNTRRLLAKGGIEHGAGHYPLFVVLHAGWLIAIFISVPVGAATHWWLIGLYVLLQVARLWTIRSLGSYWTTRVIEIPGAPRVRSGPYRYLRHPNYVVVVLEIAVLPLAFGAWGIALVFTLANAALLAWRVRVEDAALATRSEG